MHMILYVKNVITYSRDDIIMYRLPLLYQNFFFFKPMIDAEVKIKLTLDAQQHKYSPIDLVDIGKVLAKVIAALPHTEQQNQQLFASLLKISSSRMKNQLSLH